jgi:hypothetical protein
VGLLEAGDFTFHSGSKSWFKIECDALSEEDWRTAATMLLELLPTFRSVEGIPRGGIALARELEPLACGEERCDHPVLIVDDVLTTGKSMEEQRAGRGAIGAVLFSRGPCPSWVIPLFILHEGLREPSG